MQPRILETNHGELISLEKYYWAAMQRGDLPAVLELTAFPCVVMGTEGVRIIDQPTFEKNFRDMRFTIDRAELSEVDVQFPARDVAIVSYLVETDVTSDGKLTTRRFADASTWVKQDGRWKCVLHCEAPLAVTLH